MVSKLMYSALLFCVFFLSVLGCKNEVDHANVPGVVIGHSPASSKQYIGSPSLAVLPSGEYIASHDFFGPELENNHSRIHRSTDKGKTWELLTELPGQFWSSLFVHRQKLYIIGTSKKRGDVIIRRSDNGGRSWTGTSEESGILLSDSKYHCAPVPVLVHNGRIWRAFEDYSGKWGISFMPLVISADLSSNLLKPESWTVSNKLTWGNWEPYTGWLEGNMVVTPEGTLVNILRVDERVKGGKAAIVQVSGDGRILQFNHEKDFIDFPGGSKKFTIRYDDKTQQYWSLTNWIHPDDAGKWIPPRTRNTAALISSKDLRNWSVKSVILRSPDYEKTGFQYIDWLFEEEDIIAVSRTAYDDGLGGAHNAHDANYMTFHRIENFRSR
jgi:hypothetical protein